MHLYALHLPPETLFSKISQTPTRFLLSPFPVSVGNTFLLSVDLWYFQCKPGWPLPPSSTISKWLAQEPTWQDTRKGKQEEVQAASPQQTEEGKCYERLNNIHFPIRRELFNKYELNTYFMGYTLPSMNLLIKQTWSLTSRSLLSTGGSNSQQLNNYYYDESCSHQQGTALIRMSLKM